VRKELPRDKPDEEAEEIDQNAEKMWAKALTGNNELTQ
jgi:hypothetical protein